jgi:hypothetical protein
MSRDEWKLTEIGAFDVGNVALFSRPGADRGKIESNAILRQIQREFRQGYHDHLLTKLPLHLEGREAARARAEAMGQNVVEEVQTAEMLAKIAEEEKRKMTCTWTHKDDASNRRYFCSNARYVHPTRTVLDEYGVSVPDTLKVCAWHANSCAGEHGMRIRTIAIPNDQALCTSCYVKEMHVPPDEISALRVPGVMIQAPQKAAHSKTRAEIEAEERALVVAEAEKACVERRANLTETTVCTRIAARDERANFPEAPLPAGAHSCRLIFGTSDHLTERSRCFFLWPARTRRRVTRAPRAGGSRTSWRRASGACAARTSSWRTRSTARCCRSAAGTARPACSRTSPTTTPRRSP